MHRPPDGHRCAIRAASVTPVTVLSWVVSLAVIAAALTAAGHALLFKREPRAALGWIAVCLVFPAAGPLLYFLFGINRIRTRAKRLLAADPEAIKHRVGAGAPPGLDRTREDPLPRESLPDTAPMDLVRLGNLLTGVPPLPGNEVVALMNGEQAFPAMLDAIDGARQSVYLATYIFETNRTGLAFVEALERAQARGARVRVLVDGVGELYSRPRATKLLARRGVPAARFLPPRLIPPQVNINLRNHRKILVVDSRTAFTGGINLGDRHLVGTPDAGRVVDLHFRLVGPIAQQIESVFLDDWEFVTGESLASGNAATPGNGNAWARTVVDGPNEDLDKLLTLLVGAVAAARHRVWIMTPYFLPPRELLAAMKSAALRGIDVSVILPAHNNLPYVHWASRNLLWEIVQWGVEVRYQPAPFAHTKLFLMDDDYLQIGSANLDPRSLRLNFELAVELFAPEAVAALEEYFREIRDRSRRVTVEELDGRPLWERLRDATAWLFSPYL